MNVVTDENDDILLVDDTPASLKLLAGILRSEGYTIRASTDGALALKSIEAKLPSLILLDVKMPGMNGLEVCQRLKADEKTRSIPVIFISSLSDESDKVKGFRAGGVDYISKPFNSDEVLARVKTHLTLRKMQTKLEHEVEKRTADIRDTNFRLQKEIADKTMLQNVLALSEERFKLSMEATNDGLWDWNIKSDACYFSPSYYLMLGYTPGFFPAEGKVWKELIHPDDKEHALKSVGECLEGLCEKFEIEYRLKAANEEWRWILGRGKCVERDEHRRAVRLVGTHVDITGRKLAEEALKKSELQYRLSEIDLNNSQSIAKVGSWKWNIKNGEVSWSDEMFRIFGIDKKAFTGPLGEAIKNVIHPDDLHIFLSSNVSSIAEKQTFEYRIILPDTTVHYIAAKAGDVLFDRDGNPDVIMGIAQDITERKLSEQALRQAQKLESIGTLAGGIAHDFNNLMNAVLGQSSLALGKLSKESPAAVHITKAIKASERVAELTRQLLAYSGRGKFFIEEIDLNTLVKENVQILEVSLPKFCQLRYELCSPSPRIMGDISQMQQVVMNLIINAGEAMGLNPGVILLRTGMIEIKAGDSEYSKYTAAPLAPGNYALLHVQDTGCGISQKTLSRIFDPFFTTKFTGRGLGLAAVLGIIKGHQGGLRIESVEGKGTTFDIIFPFITSAAANDVPVMNDTQAVNGEGITILIIDDEPSMIELLVDILSGANFTVISVLNPLEGIEAYREHHQKISMVILDYSMPAMDGRAAFIELLKINKEVKVLLCSGYSEEETMSVFGNERPSGFFQKPYKTDVFVKRVAELLLKEH